MIKEIKKCFWAMLFGFLWILFLIKDSLGNVGHEYRQQACLFCVMGAILPISISGLLFRVTSLGIITSILVGFATYLFFGLFSSFLVRSEWGASFFPIFIDDKEEPSGFRIVL